MPSFKQLTIMGHLGGGREGGPAVRLFSEPGQTPMALFSVAVNGRVKKGDEWVDTTDWYNCKCWGKDAERAAQYLTKGAAVLVVGEPTKTEKFDQDTGEKRMYESLNVWRWTFAGSKRDSEQNDGGVAAVDDFDVGELGPPMNLDEPNDAMAGVPGD